MEMTWERFSECVRRVLRKRIESMTGREAIRRECLAREGPDSLSRPVIRERTYKPSRAAELIARLAPLFQNDSARDWPGYFEMNQ